MPERDAARADTGQRTVRDSGEQLAADNSVKGSRMLLLHGTAQHSGRSGPGQTWAVWHIRNLDIKGSLEKRMPMSRSTSSQFGCSPQVGCPIGSATYWKRWKWISLPTRKKAEECSAQLKWNEPREGKSERKREWKSGRERVAAGKSRQRPLAQLVGSGFGRRPRPSWLWLCLRSTMLVLGGPCTFSYFYGVPRNYR